MPRDGVIFGEGLITSYAKRSAQRRRPNERPHPQDGAMTTEIAPGARARLPGNYEAAKAALAACDGIDECQDWADKAAAFAAYGRMAKDETLYRTAHRIQARAVRRIGELLKLEPSAQGQRNDLKDSGRLKSPRQQAASAAGLSERQVKTAQRVSNVPREDFERQIESENPPTLTELARQGTMPRPARDGGFAVEESEVVAVAHKHRAAIIDLMRKMTREERLRFRQVMIQSMTDAMMEPPGGA
jgi:hypothetical protein